MTVRLLRTLILQIRLSGRQPLDPASRYTHLSIANNVKKPPAAIYASHTA